MRRYITALFFIISTFVDVFSATTYDVSGEVVNSDSRQPIAYVAVTVDGQPQLGGVTDGEGRFTIRGVAPGLFRLVGQSIGYEVGYSEDIQISAATQPVEIRLTPSSKQIDSIVVRPSLFRRMVDSPVSMKRIGVQEIEKSPGANRDVSRIVQSYPGVAFSPAGYRNDLVVRGGSPAENKFYVDGIEIPNINHFSTQGASGGPVSIINADLIREIEFFSGAFPIQYSGALSSVMDIKLRNGDPNGTSFKATLGASEVSLSGSGHFSEKTTYIFSLRQSYLQLLFKAIGLPFLPNFIDGQAKVLHKFSSKDELTFLAVGALDDMTLNEEGTTESAEYILGYLPCIEQQTLTTGVRYRHFEPNNTSTFVASHTYVNNINTKYQDNDESDPSKLNTQLQSTEQKTTLRGENSYRMNELFTLKTGVLLEYTQYSIDSYQRTTTGENTYDTYLGIMSWGVNAGVGYKSDNKRFSISAGGRFDGNDFSTLSSRFLPHFSPRIATSYILPHDLSVSGAIGRYYTMPPFTALSYNIDGVAVNSSLDYVGVTHYTLGLEWRPRREIFASIEGFYKSYTNMVTSIENETPLADQGSDYGTIGNEELAQNGVGRAYGVEFMGQVQIAGRLSCVASLTLFRSEYATSSNSDYRPSAWDNRAIFNASGTYFFKRGWSAGAKVSAIGGSPYTPYDTEASSLIMNWDIIGQPMYDYTLYNTGRYSSYAQIDLRVDKTLYFPKWMLGFYLDLQNAFVSKYAQPDIPVSTGEIDPSDNSRYIMKELSNISGTLLPTFGITAQF